MRQIASVNTAADGRGLAGETIEPGPTGNPGKGGTLKRTKTLGALAAVMLLALTSAGAASASALVSESPGSTTVTGTATQVNWLGGVPMECTSGGSLTGTLSGAQTGVGTAWSSMSCDTGTVTPGTCGLTLRPGTETSAGKFAGTVEVGPTGCGPIRIKVNGGAGCERTVGAQTGVAATFENIGSGKTATVKLTLNTTLKATSCGSPSTEAIEGEWSLAGSQGGSQVGVRAAAASVGFFMGGAESSEKSKQPKFEAESYSAGLLGSSLEWQVMETSFGEAECEQVELGGVISSAGPGLTFQPSFSKCSVLGFNASVKTNGCNYLYYVANSGPPYTGAVALDCPAGKELEYIAVGGLCTIKVPTQILGLAKFTTVGSGASRYVRAEASGGVTLNLNGGGGFCKGAGEGGGLYGSTKVEAL